MPSTLLRNLSLDALRGSESAARLLSFTAAAEELSLTQSAVSKRVTPQHAVDGPFYRLLVAPANAQRPEVQVFCDRVREAMAAEAAADRPHSS